jgi:hypothetical protein
MGVPDTRFSTELEDWLEHDTSKTLGELQDVFDERSFSVAVLLLMLPSALPLPTGGVTHVFEIITLLLGLEMVIGLSAIWLPERWKRRELGGILTDKALPFVQRRIRWFERWSRPRLPGLFEQRWFHRATGLLFVLLAIGALLAPPFSGLDTPPALGAVVVALAVLLRDVVMYLVGAVIGLVGIGLVLFLGSAALRVVRDL